MKKTIFLAIVLFCMSSACAFAQEPSAEMTPKNSRGLCGSYPLVDITCYGARSFSGGGAPSTTATTEGGTTVAVAKPIFVNGDGITIYGAGASNKLLTPSAPTVTASTAAGETGTGWAATIPSAVAGSAAYSYVVIADDGNGGLTAPSPPTTITNGQAKLGLTTQKIKSITRLNDVLTVVTAEKNLLNAGVPTSSGTMVHITLPGPNAMNGYYTVGSVTNPTTFVLYNTNVDTRAQGWTSSDTYNQTDTGIISYFVSNHIKINPVAGAQTYYICANRPGDRAREYHLVGVTVMQGVGTRYTYGEFDDYGSPFNDHQAYPSYVTDASCTGSRTNDMYTGRVTSGGGTTRLTVSPATSQTVRLPGNFAVVDAGPGIHAADLAANFYTNGGTVGSVYIPGSSAGGGFAFNIYSPLTIHSVTHIEQVGAVRAFEPITMSGSDTWSGMESSGLGASQFAWGSYSAVYAGTNKPIFYLTKQGNEIRRISVASNLPNGGTAMVVDVAPNTILDHVGFQLGGGSTTDDLSMAIIWRDTTNTVSPISMSYIGIVSGPDQFNDRSWTPQIWFMPGESGSGEGTGSNVPYITIDHLFVNRRGVYISNNGWSNGPGPAEINWVYRQGGIDPLLAIQNPTFTSSIMLRNMFLDTESNPIISLLSMGGFGGNLSLQVISGGVNSPIVSGVRPSSFQFSLTGTAGGTSYQYELPNRNGSHEGPTYGLFAPFDTTGSYEPKSYESLRTFFEPVHIPGGQSLYFDLPAPASLKATAGGSGSVPAGTYHYAVTAVGADFGETIASLPSPPVSADGSQGVRLTWTNPAGSIFSNIYRCSAGPACISQGIVNVNAPWSRVALHVAGASYSDTNAKANRVGVPFVTGTGSTLANKNGMYMPLGQAFPRAFASLPKCEETTEGQFATVSNSNTNTWGATIEGGGTSVVLAFCDGTHWTVYGK